jgi:hypothetical protein
MEISRVALPRQLDRHRSPLVELAAASGIRGFRRGGPAFPGKVISAAKRLRAVATLLVAVPVPVPVRSPSIAAEPYFLVVGIRTEATIVVVDKIQTD